MSLYEIENISLGGEEWRYFLAVAMVWHLISILAPTNPKILDATRVVSVVLGLLLPP
jgi:hypothetical protein